MEKLKLALSLLNKALNILNKALVYLEKINQSKNEEAIEAAKDSIIKRFEYSYDSFWKFLKKYLEFKYNLEDVDSPKSVFRACVEHEVCSAQEGGLLIDMVDDRNETTHNYDIEKVRKILPDIKPYYICITEILERVEITLK
jgi:nucleotidyltransferase substrate binding protein (TIGR01987 family)